MEQIVIKSIQDMDPYLDQLKQIKIWLCHSGCGKSYLGQIDDRFFNLDTYRCQLFVSGVENFKDIANKKMSEMIDAGHVIIDNPRFLQYLEVNNLPFVYIYARPELEAEYVKRMRDRGDTEKDIEIIKKEFKSYLYKTFNNKGNASFKIEMGAGEYLSDYMWKVFGKPKKYVVAHEFDAQKYKLVFINLKCLWNKKNKLTKLTKKTIKKLKNKVKIVFYTKKKCKSKSVLYYLKKLGLNRKNDLVIYDNGISIRKGNGEILENLPENVSKANVVQIVSQRYKFEPANCVVIGFTADDTVLFKDVGCCVAVGDAEDDVKQAAKYITDPRKDDGVAKALKKIFSV